MFIFGSSYIALTLPAVILSEKDSPVQSLMTLSHTRTSGTDCPKEKKPLQALRRLRKPTL